MTNCDPECVGVFAGLDVGAREIVVARMGKDEKSVTPARFANNSSGHRALLEFLLRGNEAVRVCLEASGNYSIDVALVLHGHRQLEVSMVNPRRARRFAESLGERSKTDPVDARGLCQYGCRGSPVVLRGGLRCGCAPSREPSRTSSSCTRRKRTASMRSRQATHCPRC